MPIIEVNNLTKKFKNLTAVNDVSFKVKKGEIFGFLGPNGAGKTTTINILTTLLPPSSGKARVNGYDVINEKDKVRGSIGLIFQEPSLDEQLTALENLKFHAWVYHVPKEKIDKRINKMLKMVELADRAKNKVETFSGGMKRRLEIARGLLHHPCVLFLDEPTIGLDPQTRSRIWEYILELRRAHNITMFMTTHYMDEAEYCDRIAIMDQGKIIALNTPTELKESIGGDVINIKTDNDKQAAEIIKNKFNLKAKKIDSHICIYVKEADKFVPKLLNELDLKVSSINIHKPTLNDVFLKLTGKEIRDEEASASDKMKRRLKTRGRPH
ncbi:MAG: ATP-binding cassette domain-containing protein [Patescibacteria group bacterium]|nr:ATP-binding cassette domain-containing protein [Patescibacteria group bacterium]